MTAQDMQLHGGSGKNALATPHIKNYLSALNAASTPERRRLLRREVAIEDRKVFTDAIQEFCAYVDPKNNGATAPERAYGNFTRQVYAAFGLNKKQIEARLSGEEYKRDHFTELEMLFVQQAERAATLSLVIGMERNLTRDEIKTGVKAAIASVRATFGYLADAKMFPEGAQ